MNYVNLLRLLKPSFVHLLLLSLLLLLLPPRPLLHSFCRCCLGWSWTYCWMWPVLLYCIVCYFTWYSAWRHPIPPPHSRSRSLILCQLAPAQSDPLQMLCWISRGLGKKNRGHLSFRRGAMSTPMQFSDHRHCSCCCRRGTNREVFSGAIHLGGRFLIRKLIRDYHRFRNKVTTLLSGKVEVLANDLKINSNQQVFIRCIQKWQRLVEEDKCGITKKL